MNIIEFLSKLDSLSAWRKVELAEARFLAENAKNKKSCDYLCRVWVLIMYAHCDNFLKESSRLYLVYLQHNINVLSNSKKKLIWLLTQGHKIFKEPRKFKSMSEVFNDNQTSFFDEKIVDSALRNGSFSYELLTYCCDWILQIDFDHVKFGDFCKILKNKRDCIAHGEEAYVTLPDDCLPWHDKAIEFIDSFKDALVKSVQYELDSTL